MGTRYNNCSVAMDKGYDFKFTIEVASCTCTSSNQQIINVCRRAPPLLS